LRELAQKSEEQDGGRINELSDVLARKCPSSLTVKEQEDVQRLLGFADRACVLRRSESQLHAGHHSSSENSDQYRFRHISHSDENPPYSQTNLVKTE
jgi:hypothetical protein